MIYARRKRTSRNYRLHNNGYGLTSKPTTAAAFTGRSTTEPRTKCTSARARHRWHWQPDHDVERTVHTRGGLMDRPSWVRNEADRLADCAAIAQCALDLIEGRVAVIETARAMQRLAFRAHDEQDPNFTVFLAIYSESDALPVGEERKNRTPSALRGEDAKIESQERWRERALQAADI
jgi:hypothetical protein